MLSKTTKTEKEKDLLQFLSSSSVSRPKSDEEWCNTVLSQDWKIFLSGFVKKKCSV